MEEEGEGAEEEFEEGFAGFAAVEGREAFDVGELLGWVMEGFGA